MAEVKDKVVTVESLSVLHEDNKKTYMTKNNPHASGEMTIEGNANFSGNVNAGSITIGSNIRFIPNGDRIEIVFLDEAIADEG